ncbi:MAG: hypothetical protein GEU98_17750 [Pseudonocardiaceae bacterium]|nr:hypothetical protein [Pseudonocardiaceae bacterium]
MSGSAPDSNRPRRAPTTLDPDEVTGYVTGQLCVLTHPVDRRTDESPAELRTLRHDLVGLMAYSSAEAVIAACGIGQPWRWVSVNDLVPLSKQLGFDVVVLDVVPPEGHRYPEDDERDEPDAELLSELTVTERMYLPSRPHRTGRQPIAELHPDSAGRPMLLVYTSREALREGCGEYQPWVAVPANRLADVVADTGAYGVLVDPTLTEEARHAAPVLDWAGER